MTLPNRDSLPFAVVPFVSIVMPVRNEADFIVRSLSAVLHQDYPHDRLEVLIADGMSSDTTRALIAEQFAAVPDIAGCVIDNPGHIVPTGLNAALPHAKGSIIVRVDGHCEIAPDYVSRCVEWLTRAGDRCGCVGGVIETIGDSPLSRTVALAMSSRFGVGDSTFRTGTDHPTEVDTVAFPAFRRSALDAAGLFDEELVRNQDDEYSYRLRALGYTILLVPDIHAVYYSRSSFRKLWWQYYQYGFWKVRVMQKHPAQMRPRQFIPPAFVAVLIGGALLMPFSRVIRALWLAVIGLYALATFGVSARMAAQHGREHLGRLPLAFFLLHAGYGAGFWVGLIKFAGRWRSAALKESRAGNV